MRRGFITCTVILLFLIQSWSGATTSLGQIDSSESEHRDILFNQTGFTEDGVYTNTQGDVKVSKPYIQWANSNSPIITRTGACSVAVDARDEVWVMGGREDPNPTQNNDEIATNLIEVFDNLNKTWDIMDNSLPFEQEYCEAEIVDDLVVVVGDWPRNSNPVQYPSGRVQIYNLTNDTWYNGSEMLQERGLGAMAAAGGYVYYAGGVVNQNANDASNVTLRYDPHNDSWLRMADMNQPRASFELVNYHGQLYAMGGFQGSQTWNRQALDYVERYDPPTDTWTNLSKLPVGMFGWSGTVLNDEIVLVGGYNAGVKNSVYHWNPIEDTWSKGNNIAPSGHFDVVVEEINGGIVWATGDTSSYAYSSWGQTFSNNFQYQNKTISHTAWLTSPVIDLRPNPQSHAIPMQINLSGSTFNSADLRFQYRASTTENTISSEIWSGPDGTINSTFAKGITNLSLTQTADFFQYRIQFTVNELENWIAPELDSMTIIADHAGFTTNIPDAINPLSEAVVFQTTHDSIISGDMTLAFALCDSFGALESGWSTLKYANSLMTESDTENLLRSISVNTNSSNEGETILDWYIEFDDLQGATHMCTKAGTEGANIVEYLHDEPIEIDTELELEITGLIGVNGYDTIVGGTELSIEIDHIFPRTSSTLAAGDLQARVNFDIQEIDAELNLIPGWTNQSTPWHSLTVGETNLLSWTLPIDISGLVYVSIEGFSNNSLSILTNQNPISLTLDNSNPVVMTTSPETGEYLDSQENRKLSILVADVSGFDFGNMRMQTWVQFTDDGTNGSLMDGLPQENEFKDINFTLENYGTLWWFNGTQSDNLNFDQQLVYMRITGTDLAGFETINSTTWWKTRDAKTSTVERIYNLNPDQFWEVSRDIYWEIAISDTNSLSDIYSVEIQLGGDSQFGVRYDITDGLCSSLGLNIDTDKTSCSHSIIDGEIILAVRIYSNWDIDMSNYDEGMVEIIIVDLDGQSVSKFENLWVYSEEFNFTIEQVLDTTGMVQGEISNDSITQTADVIRIIGSISHANSNTPYSGELSILWDGYLQGTSWFGSSAIEVFDGQINTTISMPSTGGLMDFEILFLDPLATRTIGNVDVPVFKVDGYAPLILDPNIDQLSRYRLNDVGIGVNIQEDVSWSGMLSVSCQVISTELSWEPVTISLEPSTVFQGRTLFSFKFDFSGQGDPSILSPEARLDCWAEGIDDAGWPLTFTTELTENQPWISVPLNSEGPNIELIDVKLDGIIEAGKEIRAEITIKNSGESLQESFNISVYKIVGGERTLVGLYSQSQIASGQGVVKRVAVTVPDGDWEILVVVDEDQRIWELNEDDNTFTKSYSAPDELSSFTYILGGGGILAALLLFVILRKRSGNEMTESKKLPSIDNLPRSGPPQSSRSSSESQTPTKPKRGPPPKKVQPEPSPVSTNVADAMAKLSLDTLPGREVKTETSVSSYESLPPGGDYEYLTEGTFYTGSGVGKWKLEEDGTFTKIE